jgi:hypothetical protein
MYEALQAGVEADNQPDDGPEQATPAAQVSPAGENNATTQQAVQPATPVAPEAQNTDLFDGTPINPDELISEHPELAPLVKQLQGAFTQKTQAVAEQLKQIEALGPVEEIQQAIDLFTRINDPANWGQLYTELVDAMQQEGMTLPQAQAAASEAMQEAQAAQPAQPELNLDAIEDPELAPLAQMLKAQQAELEALKREREEERLNQRAEYERQAYLGELQRQENAIRAAHPDWDDEKVLAAYQLSSFFQGNLAQGAARLEQLLGAERELYLSQKAAAATETGNLVPPRGAGSSTAKVEGPMTIKDAEAEAIEFFKARAAHYEGA